jgi:DNA-binding XRE family transcriptional regulator
MPADCSRCSQLPGVRSPLAMRPSWNGWDVSRVERAVKELVSRGVAVDSGGTLRLAHDLIRVAAVGEVPEEQRLDAHRRLGDWLMRRAGNDVRRLREALAHRHAAGLPSVDVADRLVRSPQRTLLGEDGLALLVRIADESAPSDQNLLVVNEQIAELASELARHDVVLERNLLLAERWQDSVRRARAFLDAARSAFALDDRDRARRYLARARATHAGDVLLNLELDVQQAALDLWGDGPKERGRALAHETVACGRRLYESDERARRAYLEALRVEYEAAFQEDDLEAMARAADERAAVARGFDEQAHLTGLIASGRASQRAGRLDEAVECVRYVWEEAGRRVLPRLTLDAGYWLATYLLQRGRLAEAEEIVAETLELASRVGVRRGRVSRCSGVDDRDPAPCPAEHESGTQAGRAAPDHHHVVALRLHALDSARERRRPQFPLLFLGTTSSVAVVAESPAIPDVLAEVGPRLKRLRLRRGVTLTALAAKTGISKSTLSRLESGQRKPSLELLLPLAEAHQVPLDELVGAPDVGDPRIRFKPRLRNAEWSFR